MTQPNETFELLSKLLTEKTAQLTPEGITVREKYDELFEHVTKKMAKKLNNSVYEEKTNLMLQLEHLLKRIEFFTHFPKVANTSIVTVYGQAKEVKHFFEQVLSPEDANLIRMNTNIPTIIYRDDQIQDIFSLNTLGIMDRLADHDYKGANTDLYKKDIDIRRLVQLYQLSTTHNIRYTTFIYLPSFSLKEVEMYSLLRQLGEVAVILFDEKDLWKRELQNLLKNRFIKEIHFLAPANRVEEVQQFAEKTADFIFIHSLEDGGHDWFKAVDVPCYNTAFEELLYETIMDYCKSLDSILEKQNQLIQNLGKDILTISDEEAEQLLRTLREKLKRDYKSIKSNHTLLLKDINEAVELAQQLDRLICSQSNVQSTTITKTSPYIAHQLVSLILALIDTDDLNRARGYMSKLEQFEFEYLRALEIYIKLSKTTRLSQADVKYLGKNGFLPEISRIQLRVWPQLKLDIDALYELEEQYGKSYDPQILYELGFAFECNNEIETSKNYYWRAANLGQIEAAKRLIHYVDKNNMRDIEPLANLMIPEANYHVGMYYLNKGRGYTKAVTALKMAAAYEHLGAIKELSRIEFSNYLKVHKNDPVRAENILESLIFLHQYLIDKGGDDNEVCERLGKLFYWNEHYRKAEPLLSKCNTADAQFLCGKIYQYGKGYAQDLPKAKAFFKKAKNLGHAKAENEIRKVEGWIQSNQSKEQYSASRSYSSTSYSSSSSSKGCFLTTATCVALGKPDNCEEIMAFKAYRDQNLAKAADGEKLIIEYYRIAPLLVERIDAMPNAKEIYINLYNRYIKVGYRYLQQKNMRMAKKTYIDMVKELCSLYNILPLIDQKEIIL